MNSPIESGRPLFYDGRIGTLIYYPEQPARGTDVVVIGEALDKLPFKNKNIPRFPVFVHPGTILLTPIQIKFLGGVTRDESLVMQDTLNKISLHYGIIIHANPRFHGNVLEASTSLIRDHPRTTDFFGQPFVSRVDIDLEHVPKNRFGWLAEQNKEVLRSIICQRKPRHIVELGTFFGRSTMYMKRFAPKRATIIAFDCFPSPFKSSYVPHKPNPLDNFYYRFLRFETFHANLFDETKDVYAVRYDCNKAINLLSKYNIGIDLIYIDFQKKTHMLYALLQRIHTLYPSVVVVGDDAIYKSVQMAVHEIPGCVLYNTCYTIGYNITLELKSKKKMAVIQKNIERGRATKFKYETAREMLTSTRLPPDTFVRFVKDHALNLNKPIRAVHMRDTLYHIYYKHVKTHPHYSTIEKVLNTLQPVKKVYNQICLHAHHYKDYDIPLQ